VGKNGDFQSRNNILETVEDGHIVTMEDY